MADEPTDQTDTSLPDIDKSSFPVGPSSISDNATDDSDLPLEDSEEEEDSDPKESEDSDLKSLIGGAEPDEEKEAVRPDIDAPEIADDNDLIEKEWVSKAKEIIEKTKDDPHQQSDVLTLFKADYIKKRYNKTIKTSE